MKQIDMSSEAIARRLRQASELRDLSLALMKAKRRHDEKVAREQADSGAGIKPPATAGGSDPSPNRK